MPRLKNSKKTRLLPRRHISSYARKSDPAKHPRCPFIRHFLGSRGIYAFMPLLFTPRRKSYPGLHLMARPAGGAGKNHIFCPQPSSSPPGRRGERHQAKHKPKGCVYSQKQFTKRLLKRFHLLGSPISVKCINIIL